MRLRPGLLILLPALAAAYIIIARACLALAVVNPSTSPVWAPTGLAIAASVIFGYEVWPAVLAGALVANALTAGSIETSVAIAIGNTLEGFVGAWLLNRYAGRRFAFRVPADAFWFALCAAGLAPLVSATVGVTSLGLGGFVRWSGYAPVWATWWVGDAAGALIFAPFLLLWSTPLSLRGVRKRGIELGLVLVSVVLVTLFIFVWSDAITQRHYPVGFLIIPLLVWAAFRIGPRATATAVLLFATIAIQGTVQGYGSFALADKNVSLLLLQSYIAVLMLTFLPLALATAERRELLAAEQDARSAAEAALTARDQFLSIASHELRTPVTVISGTVQLIRRRRARGETDPGRFDRPLVVILESAERLSRLIDDLLDVSRARVGRLDLHPEIVDLAALLTVATERANDRFAETHVLSFDSATQETTVRADPDRLEQVVTNLIDNAAKYSPEGGAIEIRLREGDERGLLLQVHDSGIGIPLGAERRIFTPFNRASNALASQLPGMGLGLYICQNVVEMHGGRIWAESLGEGRGTTLSVWLPPAIRETGVPAGV